MLLTVTQWPHCVPTMLLYDPFLATESIVCILECIYAECVLICFSMTGVCIHLYNLLACTVSPPFTPALWPCHRGVCTCSWGLRPWGSACLNASWVGETRSSCYMRTVVTCLITQLVSVCIMRWNSYTTCVMKLTYNMCDGISMLHAKVQLASQSLSKVIDKSNFVGQMWLHNFDCTIDAFWQEEK